MARPSKPWFRADRNTWFVTIRGQVYNLGPNRDDAYKEFYRLMGGLPPSETPRADFTVPLGVVIDQYLADLKERISKDSHRTSRAFLRPIKKALGRLPIQAVRSEDLRKAIEGRTEWSRDTQHGIYGRLAACFNWAISQDPPLAPGNPVHGIARPSRKSRAVEASPSPADFERLRLAANPTLRDILEALYDTGARPSEVTRVTAACFSSTHATWTLAIHKTARVTGRPRIIHLTPRVVETCLRLARFYPEGPLYRTSWGKPWLQTNNISVAIRHLRYKLGMATPIVPYGLRHAFATEALVKGVPDTLVAALLGHSGTRTIHENYSHVAESSRAMKEALARVRQSTA